MSENAPITEQTVLHAPSVQELSGQGLRLYIDGDAPNWIGTDERGAFLLRHVDGRTPVGAIIGAYADAYRADWAKAWLHVTAFLEDCRRHAMVSTAPFARPPYLGRSAYLEPDGLEELWLHTNNSCNLACTHCLVSSGPDGDRGLATETLLRLCDEGREMGVERFYFTGGEPFVRRDIKTLIGHVTERLGAELIVLTNATLLRNGRLRALEGISPARLRLQVSLDGATAAANDAIRGAGTFEKIKEGLARLNEHGFQTSLTAAVTRGNIDGLEGIVDVAAECGSRSVHLMWLHRRGRTMEGDQGARFPSVPELVALWRRTRARADEVGVRLDNWESALRRVDGPPGVKHDLGNAAWTSLCVYSDGDVYPSAGLANHRPLRCGSALDGGIGRVWRESPVLNRMREATLLRGAGSADPLRFFTGGGDIEHAYLATEPDADRPTFRGTDPYLDLTRQTLRDAMIELAVRGRNALNLRSGYGPPLVFHAMGQAGTVCGQGSAAKPPEVALLHSNCVLAFDVERAHRIVQDFYGQAAETPQPALCCPVEPDREDLAHVPAEVVDRFYGCGSPVADARLQPGERMIDFGCGAGIDVFVAARRVGPSGKAMGLDMTGKMLAVARGAQREVARRLGYDNVSFHEGYLEAAPLGEGIVDVVTSNCVVNLSPEKRKVFAEMWRLLADHGRLVLSDIVAEGDVPGHLRANPLLWGECISGALSEDEHYAELERAGFHGVEVLRRSFWREVDGIRFLSVTLRGFKYEKRAGCVYVGQTATYRGPLKAVVDEEGHLFPRGVPVDVCTDTAAKLGKPPYMGSFAITPPEGAEPDATASSGACSTPGCC